MAQRIHVVEFLLILAHCVFAQTCDLTLGKINESVNTLFSTDSVLSRITTTGLVNQLKVFVVGEVLTVQTCTPETLVFQFELIDTELTTLKKIIKPVVDDSSPSSSKQQEVQIPAVDRLMRKAIRNGVIVVANVLSNNDHVFVERVTTIVTRIIQRENEHGKKPSK
jgi:hypothetical protein